MKHLLLLVVLLIGTAAFSQTEDVTYEYKKGKKYIVHYAEDGNTLWGLYSTYHVSADEIIAANPGIEKGVVTGKKYMIPVGNAEAGTIDGTQLKEHTVVKGETLYSIAKKEAITVAELTKLNPGSEAGLKLGQIIRIPVKAAAAAPVTDVKEPVSVAKPAQTTVSFSDTVIAHTVLKEETLYSISKRFMVPVTELQQFNKLKSNSIKPGDVLKIPLKKENVKQVTIREVKPVEEVRKVDQDLIFRSKDQYHIAVLLPFYLDGGDGASESLKNIATEFYMGMELAVDSLEELGFKAVIHVYDVKNDSMSVVNLLKKAEMKTMDLVIGPLLPQGAEIVGNWCKTNQIRMVCPSACNSAMLKNNPYAYAAVSTDITQQRIAARYVLDNHSKDQIVLVNTGVAKDKELYDAFRDRFTELSKSKGNVKLIEIKTDDLAAYIRKNAGTVFIVPTRDKVAAIKFTNALQKSGSKAGNGTISVFATKEWAGFDDIKGVVKNKYNFHWASSSDLNYYLPETKNLLRKYRIRYKADMSRYAAHGFDVLFYFSRTLLMDKEAGQGVINAFDMEQVSEGNGYENNQCFILKHVDFDLVRVALVHE